MKILLDIDGVLVTPYPIRRLLPWPLLLRHRPTPSSTTRTRLLRVLVFFSTLVLLPVIAGVYGALHDQLSFTIAPEYFTHFKYDQFGFDPAWFGGHRPTVAVIGFLATWWVGALIALFLAPLGLSSKIRHACGRKWCAVH